MTRHGPTPRTVTALLLALATTAASQAQTVSPPGRLLASNCFQCHGTHGKGPGFERLAGKSTAELTDELRDMRSGAEGDTLMSRHALGYTDAQLRQLARWLSTQR